LQITGDYTKKTHDIPVFLAIFLVIIIGNEVQKKQFKRRKSFSSFSHKWGCGCYLFWENIVSCLWGQN